MTQPIQTTGNTWSNEISAEGAFVRAATSFRGTVSRESSRLHAAESNRYQLYVSLACPWAHRTLMEDYRITSKINPVWALPQNPSSRIKALARRVGN